MNNFHLLYELIISEEIHDNKCEYLFIAMCDKNAFDNVYQDIPLYYFN